jgi:hypothetical protein
MFVAGVGTTTCPPAALFSRKHRLELAVVSLPKLLLNQRHRIRSLQTVPHLPFENQQADASCAEAVLKYLTENRRY